MLGYNYVSTDIRYEKEAWVYPVVSFIAELGGSLGLFVGFSFLTFWDCLDFLLVKYNYQLEWDGLSKLRIESLRFYQLVNIIIRKIQEIFHLKHRPHAEKTQTKTQYLHISHSVSLPFLYEGRASIWRIHISYIETCEENNLSVTRKLLSRGADVDWRREITGCPQ